MGRAASADVQLADPSVSDIHGILEIARGLGKGAPATIKFTHRGTNRSRVRWAEGSLRPQQKLPTLLPAVEVRSRSVPSLHGAHPLHAVLP